MTYSDITLSQYENILMISSLELEDSKKGALILSVILDKSIEEILSIDEDEIYSYRDSISFLATPIRYRKVSVKCELSISEFKRLGSSLLSDASIISGKDCTSISAQEGMNILYSFYECNRKRILYYLTRMYISTLLRFKNHSYLKLIRELIRKVKSWQL